MPAKTGLNNEQTHDRANLVEIHIRTEMADGDDGLSQHAVSLRDAGKQQIHRHRADSARMPHDNAVDEQRDEGEQLTIGDCLVRVENNARAVLDQSQRLGDCIFLDCKRTEARVGVFAVGLADVDHAKEISRREGFNAMTKVKHLSTSDRATKAHACWQLRRELRHNDAQLRQMRTVVVFAIARRNRRLLKEEFLNANDANSRTAQAHCLAHAILSSSAPK